VNPNYPVFIISKGRWQSRLTVKALECMSVPYRIVVEPQEVDNYAQFIDRDNILVLPFSNLGQGSIPARNFVWDYAQANGDDWHWLLDDNINGFERLHRNERVRVQTGSIFRAAEDFVTRYENVSMAGFEYRQFSGGARRKKPPYRLNTRVYSCSLINTNAPYRWRGKYNEDTDLSLRMLKDGWVTVLFHAFLQNKAGTMLMKGGNTDEVYVDKDRREFAESLREQHPDVVKVVRRYGRWHHDVNYAPFENNALKRRADVIIPQGVNEFGMILIEEDRVENVR
jgi:hypothetical protein